MRYQRPAIESSTTVKALMTTAVSTGTEPVSPRWKRATTPKDEPLAPAPEPSSE